MEKANSLKKLMKTGLAIIVFFATITVFFVFVIARIKPDYSATNMVAEVEAADLSNTFVGIGRRLCTYYPDELLSPKDFNIDRIPKSTKSFYGTYRCVLKLKKGRTYGLTGCTASYAQRLYVNGELLSQVGKVADNKEDFVPKTDYCTVYFTPTTEQTEIILQYAHFNHKDGHINLLSLAEHQVIARLNRAEFMASGLIIGILLAFAVFFFGMFLFYTDKVEMLWFALACLCTGLHYSIFLNKDIMVFLPNLSWYVSHKLEYLCHIGFYIFLILYVVKMAKLNVPKLPKTAFFAVSLLVVLFYIIAPSTFYSYYIKEVVGGYLVCLLLTVIYLIYMAFKEKIFAELENIIVVSSLLMAVGVFIVESVTYLNTYIRPFTNILLVFWNSIALVIKFSKTEQRLELAKLHEQEIEESNAMLERMNKLKNDFMRNIAHELKTPLTIMAGYAQLTNMQLKTGKIDQNTEDNLDIISQEAMRLSGLVTGIMDCSISGEALMNKTKIRVKKLLADTYLICSLILNKNGNRLIIDCDEELFALGNYDAILQMFMNLIINANKHTLYGEIGIKVTNDEHFCIFEITDTGTGIDASLIPKVFERGVSGDSGSGLGLSISKEIIEASGGKIELTSTSEQGTCFTFTVPKTE